jgi:hypothetical protein
MYPPEFRCHGPSKTQPSVPLSQVARTRPAGQVTQSAAQVAPVSPQSQTLLPQCAPQSASHVQRVSPQLQAPSGHTALEMPPEQPPEALHVSPVVQASPSSHPVPVLYVTVQVAVPLHARVMHGGVDAQSTIDPAQLAPVQRSLDVQRLPSSQRESPERHCQVAERFVQVYADPPQVTLWHVECVVALQVDAVPAVQLPLAPFGPQPVHTRPAVSTFGLAHESAHEPNDVLQPAAGAHSAAQHSLPAPTTQAVVVGVQEHGLQVPAPLQVLAHDAG